MTKIGKGTGEGVKSLYGLPITCWEKHTKEDQQTIVNQSLDNLFKMLNEC